ncbi:MAG: hypothetical protein GY811_31265 [Myxococcales bacterium]|nr:hypothetical protein [Myxococcales bacterium]
MTAIRFAVAMTSLLACILGSARFAQAQVAEVAVLPMTTLAREMATLLGVAVQAVSSPADVPKRTKLIVDGRLLQRDNDKVEIEVQVRRASTGRPIATVSSGVGAATDIDRLVGQLVATLRPLLEQALTAAPFILPTTVVRGVATSVAEDKDRGAAPTEHQRSIPDVGVCE